MAFEFRDLLSPDFFSTPYKEIASIATQTNPLYAMFAAPMKEHTGDMVTVRYSSAVKDPAPFSPKGLPARTLAPVSQLTEKNFRPHHLFNEITVPMAAIEFLQMYDSPTIMDKGKEQLQAIMEEFGVRHGAARAVALAKTLTDGVVYVNADGDILESSSGAAYTADFLVPAANKDQLGGIIGTAWDNAGADILADLDDIRLQSEQNNCEPPAHIWMNSTAKRWFRANTLLKAYFEQNQLQADTILRGDMVDLGGYKFHFYDGTYTAADGSTKYLIPATKAIIHPEVPTAPGTGWWRAYNCSEVIATTQGVFSSLDEAAANTITVHGQFAYLYLHQNPVKWSMYMGDNFFFGFANPNSIYMPTVDF